MNMSWDDTDYRFNHISNIAFGVAVFSIHYLVSSDEVQKPAPVEKGIELQEQATPQTENIQEPDTYICINPRRPDDPPIRFNAHDLKL